MKNLVLLTGCALLAGAAGFSATYITDQDPAVTVVTAGEGVSMLVGQGGNIGVLHGSDGVFVIDSQFERMVPSLKAAIAGLQKDGEVKWLVNTHYHGDHVGGNLKLGAGATRMAHAKVRERMSAEQNGRPAAPPAAMPMLTWEDGVMMHINGQRVEMMHVGPAHTDGDTIVIFHSAGVVHMGDTFFNGMFPFVDLDSGGSVAGALRVLKETRKEMPPHWKIIPGHGELAGAEDLDRTVAMIEATLAIVKERVAGGMNAAAVVAAGLPTEWADWSWQFIPTDRWLQTLARECGAQ